MNLIKYHIIINVIIINNVLYNHILLQIVVSFCNDESKLFYYLININSNSKLIKINSNSKIKKF